MFTIIPEINKNPKKKKNAKNEMTLNVLYFCFYRGADLRMLVLKDLYCSLVTSETYLSE